MSIRTDRPSVTSRSKAARQKCAASALALLSVVGCLALLVSCAVNPVTGKRELNLVSESQEIQIGAQSDQQIVAQYGLVDDPQLAAYVSSLGSKIVPVSHRPDLQFHYRLLDDPVVNAFALPGGYVYITRGILAYLEDEAALAAVMGHETGHVTARHGAKQMTQQELLGLGIGIGSAVSDKFAQLSGLAGTAAQLLMLKYSRDDERQADLLGVEYATKLGYDTREMANFFQTLGRLSEGNGRLPTWQSTHPDPGERYQNVISETQQWQSQVGKPSYVVDRDSYLRRLEGLVFGENPRHGFVRDNAFIHPDLALRFPVPSGWQVQNSAAQVVLAPQDGASAVLFGMDDKSTDPSAAADAFVTSAKVQVAARQPMTIHGFSALRLTGTVAGQQGDLGITSTFIAYKGHVYTFHGLTAAAALSAQRAVLDGPADGFAALTDPQLLSIQPVVLHIVTVSKAGTFRDVVAANPIPDGAGIDVAGLALVNGVQADSPVQQGELIKVLRRRAAS